MTSTNQRIDYRNGKITLCHWLAIAAKIPHPQNPLEPVTRSIFTHKICFGDIQK
jgi:hypothetical protein